MAFDVEGTPLAFPGVRGLHRGVVRGALAEGRASGQGQGGIGGGGGREHEAAGGVAGRRRAGAGVLAGGVGTVQPASQGCPAGGAGARATGAPRRDGAQPRRPRLRRDGPEPDELVRVSRGVGRGDLAGLQGDRVPVPGAGAFGGRHRVPGLHGQGSEACGGHASGHGGGGIAVGVVVAAHQAGDERRARLAFVQRGVAAAGRLQQPAAGKPSRDGPRPHERRDVRPALGGCGRPDEPRADAVHAGGAAQPAARAAPCVATRRHPALGPRGGQLLGDGFGRLRGAGVWHGPHPGGRRARADVVGHQRRGHPQATVRPPGPARGAASQARRRLRVVSLGRRHRPRRRGAAHQRRHLLRGGAAVRAGVSRGRWLGVRVWRVAGRAGVGQPGGEAGAVAEADHHRDVEAPGAKAGPQAAHVAL